MGLLDVIKQNIPDPFAKITSAVGGTVANTNFYEPKAERWFEALPYAFIFTDQNGKSQEFPLPINPSNLNVTTHFATNVVTTIYGTVEEHSDIRYFDINIRGTTGFAPKFTSVNDSVGAATSQASGTNTGFLAAITNTLNPPVATAGASVGRKSFQITGPVLGGLFKKTIGAVNSIVGQVNEIVGGEKYETGIDPEKSGYIAFHNFYRFLMKYKRSVSSGKFSASAHPLVFVNYKDGVKYDVVIRTFTMERSAENPLLYVYNITARGYNLASADSKSIKAENMLDRLGLSGVQSGTAVGKMRRLAGAGRSIFGSLVGGINSFGR